MREMEVAVREEDYAAAARIRDHPWMRLAEDINMHRCGLMFVALGCFRNSIAVVLVWILDFIAAGLLHRCCRKFRLPLLLQEHQPP
jgi:hypothetical protein